jgi:hypothetical protein
MSATYGRNWLEAVWDVMPDEKIYGTTTLVPEKISLDWEIKDFWDVLEYFDPFSARINKTSNHPISSNFGVNNLKLSFQSGVKVEL